MDIKDIRWELAKLQLELLIINAQIDEKLKDK